MTANERTNSIKMTARVAGILYLLHSIFGGFGILYIPSLIVPGDITSTVNNIMASESLFRLAFTSGLIGQVVLIPLVLVLYKLLKPVNKNHAVFMVVFAIVGISISMLNALNQIAALLLLSGADYLTVFTTEQLQALVMFFLDLSETGLFIVQIFWGLWLFPMGYLIFKSGFIPKILGIALTIAGFGYLLAFFSFFLFPNTNAPLAQIAGILEFGEIPIIFWFLIKGVNVEQWEKRELESV